jgi:hypothetical protein
MAEIKAGSAAKVPGTTMPRGRGRLPNYLMPCIDPALWGHVAEWLRNGLQSNGFVE